MIRVNEENKPAIVPYLARVKKTGAIVVIGIHSAIILNCPGVGCHAAGDGWSDLNHDDREILFEPLKPGEIITLQNE